MATYLAERTIDAPFLPSKEVRVRELEAIDFNDGGKPRRWFSAYIQRSPEVVLIGGHLKPGAILCGEHGITEDCDHVRVVRKFIEDEE